MKIQKSFSNEKLKHIIMEVNSNVNMDLKGECYETE